MGGQTPGQLYVRLVIGGAFGWVSYGFVAGGRYLQRECKKLSLGWFVGGRALRLWWCRLEVRWRCWPGGPWASPTLELWSLVMGLPAAAGARVSALLFPQVSGRGLMTVRRL